MALSAEDKAEIAQIAAAAVAAAQQNQPPAAPPVADPAPIPPQAAPAPQGEDFKALLAETLKQVMGETQQAQESQLGQSLWDERVNELKTANPALGEYLDGEDEWGRKRMEILNGEGDFGKRLGQLKNLTTRFNNAQMSTASGNTSTPSVPKRIQEMADKQETKYQEIEQKMASGELTPEQASSQFFDILNAEVLVHMN